jgi:hypothetical protein
MMAPGHGFRRDLRRFGADPRAFPKETAFIRTHVRVQLKLLLNERVGLLSQVDISR